MGRYLIDSSSLMLGKVSIGAGSIIEPFVVLGHPSAQEVARGLDHIDEFNSVGDFYSAAAKSQLVIGENSIIRSGSVIYSGARIGCNFDCGHGVIIRENVEIGDGVYVKNGAEIMSRVKIGPGCRVAGVIADNAVLGKEVSSFGILTHRYGAYLMPRKAGISPDEPPLQAPVVCDRAIVGRGAIIIGPRRIGRGAVIGPNIVVNFDVDDGEYVALDNPKIITRQKLKPLFKDNDYPIEALP